MGHHFEYDQPLELNDSFYTMLIMHKTLLEEFTNKIEKANKLAIRISKDIKEHLLHD